MSKPIAAIYARVSTLDQKEGMQLTELRQFCKRSGWQVVEYTEKASSVKHRPVLEQLLQDAQERKFEIVVVWKLDRFARSMKQFVDNVMLLYSLDIRFICATQGIDTGNQNPTAKFLMHILAAFAELEHNMIVERVRAGVAEAQRKGVHCGRPARIFRRDKAQEMREQGMSLRAIARELEIPLSTVVDCLKRRVRKVDSKPLKKPGLSK